MPPLASSASGAVRRSKGFARFALAVQYHGGSFLGVTYQGAHGEDCVRRQKRRNNETKWDTVDLRGHRSVEGRLREALDDLFGTHCWENIQFSSRTDRGVHALKNTFHVDIQVSKNSNNASNENHAKATKSESKSVDSLRKLMQKYWSTDGGILLLAPAKGIRNCSLRTWRGSNPPLPP